MFLLSNGREGGRGAEEAVPERFIEKWMRFVVPADLMLPGVVVPPSGLPRVQRGTLCAVTLLGNRYRGVSSPQPGQKLKMDEGFGGNRNRRVAHWMHCGPQQEKNPLNFLG